MFGVGVFLCVFLEGYKTRKREGEREVEVEHINELPANSTREESLLDVVEDGSNLEWFILLSRQIVRAKDVKHSHSSGLRSVFPTPTPPAHEKKNCKVKNQDVFFVVYSYFFVTFISY